ncbi:MAG: serine/threonine-protein phosphatase [Melioribacteraceae bacterium]|nr:serine/threonine-protein phosphatase [Melioribacteraceae bacterium]
MSDIFVTLSIVVIHKNKNEINYCGAGDIPLFHLSKDEVKLVKSDGTLLGFQKDGNYKDIHVTLQPDDEIFVLTDGIIESRDTRGNFIDNERLINIIKAKGKINSIKFIEESVKELTNDKFEDDTTIISLKKL